MYDDVLLPTDGSDATASIAHAADVADWFDATVHVLFVASTNRDSVTVVGTDVVDALEREGTEIVEQVATDVRERGVECATEVVQGDPATTIADYAESRGMDLVVMPTHGRTGLSRFLLGSVTENVLRRSDVPVLTLRTDEDARATFPYEDVVVPTDGSETATAAANGAIELASALDATLHAISVVDEASLGFDVRSAAVSEELEADAAQAVADVADRASDAGVENVESVRHGTVHREILDYVEENDVDAVAMGTTGRSGTDRVLLGSVTERIVRTSPVPVWAIRR